jgi:hypothetical protein
MAFIVIAIVAAILLITSVRSHASAGVLDSDTIRPAVVAAFPLARR